MSPLGLLAASVLALLAWAGRWWVRHWWQRQVEAQQRLGRAQGRHPRAQRALDALSRVCRGLFVLLLVVFVVGFGLCGGWGVLQGLAMIEHAGEQGAYGRVMLVLGGLGLVFALASLAKLILLLKNRLERASADPAPLAPKPPQT